MVLQRRGPICMFGKSTSASRPSMSCSWSRCSGGPTPAVSSTFTPNGCQLSLVRPARKSMKGTGRGSWPSTSSASPPSGRRIVRGALFLYLAGIRGVQRSGRTSRWPSLEIRGGSAGAAMAAPPFHHVGGSVPSERRSEGAQGGAEHGSDTGSRRDARAPAGRAGGGHGAHLETGPRGSRPPRAVPPSRGVAGADAAGMGRRRGSRRRPPTPRGSRGVVPEGATAAGRLRAGRGGDLGRRSIRELQGGHHPAVLRAGVRVDRAPAVGGVPVAEGVGRAEGGGVLVHGAPPRGEAPHRGPPRRGVRRLVRVPAAASPARPRLHEHAAVPGLRAPGLPLPRRPLPGELLRAAGHRSAWG